MNVITVENPASGKWFADISVTTPDEIKKMVEKARIAQKEWFAVSFSKRQKALRRLQRYLQWHYQEFIDVIQKETSKVWVDAMLDPLSAVGELSFWCGQSERIMEHPLPPWPHWVLFNNEFLTRLKPLPVVGLITPWNLPLAIPAADFVPALLGRSAVIWKPSEFTTLTALRFREVFDGLGCFPENLLQVAVGFGETGQALADLADTVLFTGSRKTGRQIEKRCLERQVPYHLEMGGKAPFIVWPPVNIERAANCFVWNACANAGHYCKAAEQCFVARPVADDFIRRVCEKAAALRLGIDIGPIITKFQLKIIQNQVDDAVAKGAKVLYGGQKLASNSRFFLPTVLTDVNPTMDVLTQETFGPLMPIMVVDELDEAIDLSNDSHFGLNGVVFCKDRKTVEYILDRLEVGNPNVNTAMLNWMAVNAPQCAMKESSGTRSNVPRHGEGSLERTCVRQTVVKHKFPLPLRNSELFWYPYTRWTKLIMRLFIHTFYPFV